MNDKYLSLQILRAVAAWMVVYHHFMQIYFGFKSDIGLGEFFSRYGSFGVDIFFVLSGAVMYGSLSRRSQGARAFWINRLFRIAPAYWLMTLLLITLKQWFPAEFAYTDYDLGSLAGSLLFLPTHNPSGLGEYPTLVVGWTLNFEMFFYSVLALCLYVAKSKAALLCALVLLLLPLVWPENAVFARVAGNRLLYEFVAGIGIAALFGNARSRAILLRYRIVVVLACLTLLVLFAPGSPDSRLYALLSAGALVLGAMSIESSLGAERGWVRAMVGWGDASYSTYLIHPLVLGVWLHFTGAHLSVSALCATVVGATASVALGSRLSHRWVEQAGWLTVQRRRLLRRVAPRDSALDVA